MTKETIDVNQTDPIKTVPSHFHADTSTANITYQYPIIRFTGADQQSINSLASSHNLVAHNNYSVPMSTCTHGYRTFVAELSFITSASLRVHCPSHAKLHNSISMPNRVCNTVTDKHNSPWVRSRSSCCTVMGALEEYKMHNINRQHGSFYIQQKKGYMFLQTRSLENRKGWDIWWLDPYRRTSFSDLAPVNKLSVWFSSNLSSRLNFEKIFDNFYLEVSMNLYQHLTLLLSHLGIWGIRTNP